MILERLRLELFSEVLLLRLLQAQREVQKEKPHIELITNQELIAIQTIWYRDFIFDQKVS